MSLTADIFFSKREAERMGEMKMKIGDRFEHLL